jgi:TatA/E family protein of Tat protein translocase
MPTVLLNFEFFATSDMLLIAFVALLIFGPRKLPEIGRKLGKSLAEFRRASDEFKRTWEYEVELEQRKAGTETDARQSLAVAPAPQLQPEPQAVARDAALAGEGATSAAHDLVPVASVAAPAPRGEEEEINPS